VQATLVDALRAAGDDADLERRPQHDGIERLAALRGVLLGVVERRQRTDLPGAERVQVEQDGGRHERPGQAAPAGLVRSGHEPDAEAAVVLDQPPAGRALAPGGLAAGGGGGRGHDRGDDGAGGGRPVPGAPGPPPKGLRAGRSGPAASRSRRPRR
jgi:hypothetical protein